MTKKHFILAFLLLVALSILPAYRAGLWRFNYPSAAAFPVQGLDVSHHQKVIDWSRVPKDRISFVYIKASEGGDWQDENFRANWAGALKAGFSVGAYHYYTLCKGGATQSKNFLSILPQEQGDKILPPAIDLEFGGNCAERPAKDGVLHELNAMIAALQKRTGHRPVLYVTYEFYDVYLRGTHLAAEPLWLRNIYIQPDKKDFPSMVMWQYAANARIIGIEGPVDLNISFPRE